MRTTGSAPTDEIEAWIQALAERPQEVELEPLDRAIVDYALKLTESPGSIDEEDINTLRSHGLDDQAIHDLAAIVAYFAFVNRIADGLGVELEEKV